MRRLDRCALARIMAHSSQASLWFRFRTRQTQLFAGTEITSSSLLVFAGVECSVACTYSNTIVSLSPSPDLLPCASADHVALAGIVVWDRQPSTLAFNPQNATDSQWSDRYSAQHTGCAFIRRCGPIKVHSTRPIAH